MLRPLFPLVASLAVAAVLLPARPARAGTAAFRQGEGGYAGAQDLTISDQNARWNDGRGNTDRDGSLGCFRVSGKDGYEARALLRFTGLSLPREARVTEARLTLTFDNWARGFAVQGYYLKQGWRYGARGLGWRLRDDGQPWVAPGALGARDAPAFRISELTGRGDETITVALDPQVVQDWARRPESNHGLLLVNDTPDRVTRIHSAEHPDLARRPRLAITYTLPGEGSAQAPTPAPAPGHPGPGGPGAVPPQRRREAGRPRLLLTENLLGRLQQRAREGAAAWTALRERCDAHVAGRVEWPDGNDYPGGGSVGEGYQGSGYFDPLLSLGLCHQLVDDPARARRYGERGTDILIKMSEPTGPHAVDPLRDSGYGIRFFGVGMAIGYDWLHDALSPAQRRRVAAALDRWLGAYERKGFGREHPQGNYFAGYYAAKALTGLSTRGEAPSGEAHLQDWLVRVHRGMVQPYYAAHLSGGGWPEGWNYGPLATLNMSWPALVSPGAGGPDLVRDGAAPYLFPLEQGAHLIHFTWPSRRTLDDRHVQYEGRNPAAAQPSLFTTQAGILRLLGDALAPVFQRYAREVRAAEPGDVPPWVEFLFWDEAAPERDFRALPRSYLARGLGTIAMRSSWDTDAVWASFTAGPYVNYPGSGEQYFDQGALAVVRGDRPLLVNAAAALLRHRPGTEDGRGYDDLIYNEIFQGGNRRLFNIFYVAAPQPYGQAAVTPREARTRVGLFEDGDTYVIARGERLEDMYRTGPRGARAVLEWSRTVLYLRPGRFLLFDQTAIADESSDQWLAFHLPERPLLAAGRYEVGAGASRLGALTPLLPEGARGSVVDVFGRGKVFRLELRPGLPSATQRWLTLLDVSAPQGPRSREDAGTVPVTVLSAKDGSAPAGVQGAAIGGADASVILFCDGKCPAALRYRVPLRAARHLLVGLAPSRGYGVRGAVHGGVLEIEVREGGGAHASGAGVLSVVLRADGTAAGPGPSR